MTQTKNPHKVNKRSARTPQSLASTLKAENFGSSNEIQYPQRIDLSYFAKPYIYILNFFHAVVNLLQLMIKMATHFI